MLPTWQEAHTARTADASMLATLLRASRARTLALAEAYVAALGPDLPVPYSSQLNPPLWELGHIGWFQEYWIARNPQCPLGTLADPDCPRTASLLAQSDALYNSSQVAHATRWHLPLPNLAATRRYLAKTLNTTLTLLADSAQDDAALYFYRLALFHEDMHGEAAAYMAQALGLALPEALAGKRPRAADEPVQSLRLKAGDWTLGYADVDQPNRMASGFAFDNELAPHTVNLSAYEIDSQPVTWGRYLPFVAKGGYTAAQWWSAQGRQWLQSAQGCGPIAQPDGQAQVGPRFLRQVTRGNGEPAWEHHHFGQWQPLDKDAPACHLTYFEAEAWCRWAGRQLPTEAQWERAAMTRPGFHWGQVWEWTASTFNPYPGFEAHPYRDYSAPWFGNRPVLRGASWATAGRMAHPRYRNYFTPERNDLHAGFRTCTQ